LGIKEGKAQREEKLADSCFSFGLNNAMYIKGMPIQLSTI
jgi:hypothetical protein